jgi:hypothetical protein
MKEWILFYQNMLLSLFYCGSEVICRKKMHTPWYIDRAQFFGYLGLGGYQITCKFRKKLI